MSRTYRRHRNGGWTTQGKLNSQYKELEKRFETSRKKGIPLEIYREWFNEYKKIGYLFHSYSKNPSHWNHDFGTVPRRAKEKNILKKIIKGEIDPDGVTYPDGKKGTPYYW